MIGASQQFFRWSLTFGRAFRHGADSRSVSTVCPLRWLRCGAGNSPLWKMVRDAGPLVELPSDSAAVRHVA